MNYPVCVHTCILTTGVVYYAIDYSTYCIDYSAGGDPLLVVPFSTSDETAAAKPSDQATTTTTESSDTSVSLLSLHKSMQLGE